MKTKWKALAFIALAVLFIGSQAGCEKRYTEQNMLEIAADSYELGRIEGSLASSEPGYDDGYYDGYQEGYEKGSMEGYDIGYQEGYRSAPLETTYSDGYHKGWIEGTAQGEATGYQAGESDGYKQGEKVGYDKGFEAGIARGRLEVLMERLETIGPTVAETLSDLAYIQTTLGNYSDDAYPTPNGISLRIWFYDSKSELIRVKDVSLTVIIKLYKISGETSFPTKGYDPLLYQDTVTINSTSESIRIPFEDYYGPDYKPDHYAPNFRYNEVWVQVTVTTPDQEEFSVTSKGVAQFRSLGG